MPNEAWNRRRTAAKKYQPSRVRLLIVAESPPEDEDTYFYFTDPKSRDALFDEVCGVLFEETAAGNKEVFLKELRRRGVYVVELKPDGPRVKDPLAPYVTPFLLNLETYAPEKIVLLGDAYSALHGPMTQSELPLIDVKVPSPDAGVEFRQKLRQALVRGELEKLIRPLKKKSDDA